MIDLRTLTPVEVCSSRLHGPTIEPRSNSNIYGDSCSVAFSLRRPAGVQSPLGVVDFHGP